MDTGFLSSDPELEAQFRQIEKVLQDYRYQKQDDFEKALNLSSLPKKLRAKVHQLCRRLGMKSKSSGSGEDRMITVTRCKSPMQSVSALVAAEGTEFSLTEDATGNIERYLERHRITESDRDLEQANKHPKVSQRSPTHLPQSLPRVAPHPYRPPRKLQEQRQRLPIFKQRQHVLDSINTHRVVLISGGTGCGKSTQVTQYLLEQSAEFNTPVRVVCTQPRRLPATSVATRVAKERGEQIGGPVGYHIRLKQRLSPQTLLTYCTSGVLLRTLSDGHVSGLTHVILDEVHEREQQTDFLMTTLREQLDDPQCPFKLILMSATMESDLDLFRSYFPDVVHISVESSLHEVDEFFLEDVLRMTDYEPPNRTFGAFKIGVFGQDGPEKAAFANSITFGAPLDTSESECWDKDEPQSSDQKLKQVPSVNLNQETKPESQTPLDDEDLPDVIVLEDDVEVEAEKPEPTPANNPNPNPEPPVDLVAEPFTGKMVNLRPDLNDRKLLGWYRAGRYRDEDRPDLELAVAVLNILVDSPIDGAVLVFLSGYDDIISMNHMIDRAKGKWKLLPVVHVLHSEMDNANEQSVFEHAQPGTRKVILATNIAEASLTIDDVVFVIDGGKVKEQTYQHESQISRLLCVSISRANAVQRKGRAGRCQHGYCFRLFSREEFMEMKPNQTPELLRMAIHEVCLHAKLLAPTGVSVRNFIAKAPSPPSDRAVSNSLAFLTMLGALNSFEETLTQLGRTLAEFPMEPQLARMMLMGVALRCLDPVVSLVALLSYRDPFILPRGDDRSAAINARESLAKSDMSDHLVFLRAWYGFDAAMRNGGNGPARAYCYKHFLSFSNMMMIKGIRSQLYKELKRLQYLTRAPGSDTQTLNRLSGSWPMVKAAITFGAYPGVGFVRNKERMSKIRTSRDNHGRLHPSSSLKPKNGVPTKVNVCWVVFQEVIELNGGVSLRSVSAVNPSTIALFSGPSRLSPESMVTAEQDVGDDEDIKLGLKEEEEPNLFQLENTLAFKLPPKTSRCLMQLRLKVHAHFMNTLRSPGRPETNDQRELLTTVRKVLEEEDQRNVFPDVSELKDVCGPIDDSPLNLSLSQSYVGGRRPQSKRPKGGPVLYDNRPVSNGVAPRAHGGRGRGGQLQSRQLGEVERASYPQPMGIPNGQFDNWCQERNNGPMGGGRGFAHNQSLWRPQVPSNNCAMTNGMGPSNGPALRASTYRRQRVFRRSAK